MIRKVNHKRVIQFQELYEGENYIYCVMDLCEGTDLYNAIVKYGGQNEAKALEFLYYFKKSKI